MNDFQHVIELKPCCMECWYLDTDIDTTSWWDRFNRSVIGCKHLHVCEKYHKDDRLTISEIVKNYISQEKPGQ